MGEIIEELNYCSNGGAAEEDDLNDSKKVEIILRTIGPARPSRLFVPSHIRVSDLQKLIAIEKHLPTGSLKLILKGKVLNDNGSEDNLHLQLKDGDSLIVAVKPKPPVKQPRDGFDDDDDEEDLKFQLPASSSLWKKRLYSFLHHKLKFPDILLMVIFSLSIRMWTAILIWFILAPIAHSWDLGPLYILGTGFFIILLNLGKRQPGDMSAYSIFNEDFRELPGTLNADRLDRDIRLGQF